MCITLKGSLRNSDINVFFSEIKYWPHRLSNMPDVTFPVAIVIIVCVAMGLTTGEQLWSQLCSDLFESFRFWHFQCKLDTWHTKKRKINVSAPVRIFLTFHDSLNILFIVEIIWVDVKSLTRIFASQLYLSNRFGKAERKDMEENIFTNNRGEVSKNKFNFW